MMTKDGIEGLNLNTLVKLAMEAYDLDPSYDIQVDYWSNML